MRTCCGRWPQEYAELDDEEDDEESEADNLSEKSQQAAAEKRGGGGASIGGGASVGGFRRSRADTPPVLPDRRASLRKSPPMDRVR